MAPTTLLSLGTVTKIKQGEVYALPSKLAFITSSHAVEVSLDKTTWTALAGFTAGAISGHAFIRCNVADANIAVKDATQIAVSSQSGPALPTAPLGQVLISQGDGIAPIFSANPVINQLDANGSIVSRYVINCAEGALSSAYALQLGYLAFSTPGDIEGKLSNFYDSSTAVIGAKITGGGTNKVTARWNGTNWIVVAADTVKGIQVTDPTAPANQKQFNINSKAGMLEFEIVNDAGVGGRKVTIDAIGSMIVPGNFSSMGSISSVGQIVGQNGFVQTSVPLAQAHVPSNGSFQNFSDSTTNIFGAIVAGGGTYNVTARYNGTNWIVWGGGVLSTTRLSLPETNFADLTNDDRVKGTVANIKDSVTDNPGQIVVPGGSNSVLARYNGNNWIVII